MKANFKYDVFPFEDELDKIEDSELSKTERRSYIFKTLIKAEMEKKTTHMSIKSG